MKKKAVLVTGTLTGIGRAAAFAFATQGARVVVSGRRDDTGEALANELRPLGSEAEYIRADVRKENDIRDPYIVRTRTESTQQAETAYGVESSPFWIAPSK
jgi:NAD(P)-dependent dehydrogenase (short-subunit alcohol dehydrogenase family)